jgi:NAD(P)-dependent dehydrogenase (short-subunit alcohol dehydrogenase family)
MALVTLARFVRGRLFPPSDPLASLEGKTVLVTGATAGLGLEAALKYARLGANLVLGCRSLERGQQVKDLIEGKARRSNVVRIYHLDMNDYQSVISFAGHINGEIPKLDIALLNAGLIRRSYSVSPSGWEETLQVNTLSTALLGLLLLPKLRQSGTTASPAHLTFVSSGAHRLVQPESLRTDGSILQLLNQPDRFSANDQYRYSKALLEFTVKSIANLTRREDGSVEIIVNSVCPGFCRSNLPRDFDKFYERLARRIFYAIFGRSPEQGSRTLVSGTLLGMDSHGKFWRDDEYPE